MNVNQLIHQIKLKKTYLCVGLDTALERLPGGIPKNVAGVLEFNKAIIEATSDVAVAYKINTAFYESMGSKGWNAIEETRKLIPDHCFTIADAKRGDIGNTSTMYAHAFFNSMDFDALTVAPYMGRDSIEPFLAFEDKVTIVLGLTSNPGSADFQTANGQAPLYKDVLQKVSTWGSTKNLMFVVGATKAEKLKEIRNLVPDHFLLIPGVGAQGGSAEEVCKHGQNSVGGLLINSSRGIIYASSDSDFAEKAREQAIELSNQMRSFVELI